MTEKQQREANFFDKKAMSEILIQDDCKHIIDDEGENLQFIQDEMQSSQQNLAESKITLGWGLSQKSSDQISSQGRQVSKNPKSYSSGGEDYPERDYNVLDNTKLFKERIIGISQQIQPRRARHMRKRDGYYHILQKNFVLAPRDEDELLENLLIHAKPRTLNKIERKVLKIIVKRGYPDKYRKHLWLRASGAAASMSMPENKDYYKNLKQLSMQYPNPSFGQIELDLRRTFFELKMSKSETLIIKLRNVLATFCKRNPTIGYCQGMNFLVGRLLKVIQNRDINATPLQIRQSSYTARRSSFTDPRKASQIQFSQNNFMKTQASLLSDTWSQIDHDRDEEEAFWIFTHMVESLLPIDYYSNMVGVLVDQKIFYLLFKEKIPDLCEHLEEVGFDPSLLAFQWFVCLLGYNMPQEVSNKVWDFFFLKGQKALFRISLALLHLMRKELMQTKDFAEIFEILEAFPRKMIDERTLIQTSEIPRYKEIKNRQIRMMRREVRIQIESNLQKLVTNKESYNGTYQRLKFLNKFYLYNGIHRSENDTSTVKSLYQKSLDQYENEVMRVFNCDPSWPICLFDFTYKNRIPNFLAFKAYDDLGSCVIEDYFYSESEIAVEREEMPEQRNGLGLLMERGSHICECQPKFVYTFKRMYEKGDLRLLQNQHLQFTINNDLRSEESLQKFVNEISRIDLTRTQDDTQAQYELMLLTKELGKPRIKSFKKSPLRQNDQNQQKQSIRFATTVVLKVKNNKIGDYDSDNNTEQQDQFNDDDDDQQDYDEDNEDDNPHNEKQRLQASMSSLHQSALDILTEHLDKNLNPCLLVRHSTRKVYDTLCKQDNPSILINHAKIIEFIQNLELKVSTDGIAYEKWAKYHLDPNSFTLEQVITYVLVVDAMNFCFWPGNPSGNFEYEHMTKNLASILATQPEFFTAAYLSSVTASELQSRVFNNMDFALLGERARILNEMGVIIASEYEGSFLKFIEKSRFDVPTLVRNVACQFTGFRDEAIYQGEQIFFYKRAQILVADLFGALQEKTNLESELKFLNLEQVTMFADYRVPQILRHVGIFTYSKDLSQLIDNEQELPYSSTQEVEIRACTVVAVELILEQIKLSYILKDKIKYAFEVDWLLWQMGENSLSEMLPHHKVHSIFY